jgi:hypothetical protein
VTIGRDPGAEATGQRVLVAEPPPGTRHQRHDRGVRRPPRIAGHVRIASGPWAVEEGWWGDDAIEREYWDVELDGGGIYRLYRDVKSGDWFADGIYD